MSVLQAMGDAFHGLFVIMARQIIVLLPAAWLLSRTGSVGAVWFAFPIAEIAAVAASVFFLRHLFASKLRDL
jgi:Na+-driven multidrug efflux pump